jgi:hypothetical protein
VTVYNSTLRLIRRLRSKKVKTAVVSSSKNCRAILETAAIENLFDAVLDGKDAAERKLDGKPAPDIFLEAARQRPGVLAEGKLRKARARLPQRRQWFPAAEPQRRRQHMFCSNSRLRY